jgi:hypothetical protein
MAAHFREMASVIVVAIVCSRASAAVFEAQSTEMRRVRDTGDVVIAGLIDEGIQRSATFRGLVDRIGAGDGLVYVEQGECGTGVRACLVHWMTVAGSLRILRVLVNTRRDRDGLIGAVGHELQHAVEVLANPAMKTTQDMFFHSMGRSMSRTSRFETQEAIRVGSQIERELRRGR